MIVWFATGMLLRLLALLMRFLPEKVVFLLWGKRRRVLLTGEDEKITERILASKELKIIGTIVFAKCLFDYLIASLFY